MTCNLTERVSLLIDGALSDEDATEARNHITICSDCRNSMEAFLRIRETLSNYESNAGEVARRRVLDTIFAPDRTPLWRRSVSLPFPALALLLVAFVALGLWSVATRGRSSSEPAAEALRNTGTAAQPASQIALELSRLDHGGRAVIIKVPKPQTAERPESRGRQ
jgi:hypothetical protein